MHVQEEKCQVEILRVPLERLSWAFDSGQHRELENFINRDSDGLGNPLPREAFIQHALAVAYSNNLIPEYNGDVLTDRDTCSRERRSRLQRSRRTAKRLGVSMPATPPVSLRLEPHRNSTIHVVKGALAVLQWTGSWHYREQMELLNVMGLHKSEDYIRDRVRYLQRANPTKFKEIELWAPSIKDRRSR